MGLDMYIFKLPREEKPNWGKGKKVAYWRKANAIHKFFVETTQDGIDDCEIHNEITRNIVLELMNRCDRIINEVKLVPATITNGYRFTNGKQEPILQDGYVVDDESLCAELLPSEGGFFFGSTDYNQYYYEDIKETYVVCRRLLETTNFETEALFYASSW